MVPRRAKKQAATEVTAVAADGKVTPSKRRKLANPVTEAAQRPKAPGLRTRTRATKRGENAATDESASPSERSRLRLGNATTKENVETEGAPGPRRVGVVKRQRQKRPTTAVENTGEEIAGRKMGEKSREKKAGTKKPAAAKVQSQVPEKTGMKKRAAKVTTKGDKDIKEKETGRSAPVKRSRRVNKPVEEESQQPMVEQIATKTLRKHKIIEEALEKVVVAVEKATKVVRKVAEAVNIEEEPVISKKTRGRGKKREADIGDAPKVKAKERSKKASTKSDAKVLPKKSGTVEHNTETTAATENNSRAKDAKASKKPVSRAKHHSRAKKVDNAQAEEVALPEANIEENGNTVAEMTQTEHKQKKGNTGSEANNGKPEIKRGKKKEQEVIIVKEETMENAITEDETEDINLVPQILNDTVTNDVPSINNNGSLQEAEDAEVIDEANGGNVEEVVVEDLNLTTSRLLIYETD
ncbi:muscle M-line assembly protein unc-89 [Ooceraea biroi]|uniref:muscle M-line assembly protein unc-89 n=1 Tax=Ooceraea biroi TaxID=2015173 RepID=UPI000F07E0BC|nr:muscle M-line assembly protein unc-89 [Ooceraea biroi]